MRLHRYTAPAVVVVVVAAADVKFNDVPFRHREPRISLDTDEYYPGIIKIMLHCHVRVRRLKRVQTRYRNDLQSDVCARVCDTIWRVGLNGNRFYFVYFLLLYGRTTSRMPSKKHVRNATNRGYFWGNLYYCPGVNLILKCSVLGTSYCMFECVLYPDYCISLQRTYVYVIIFYFNTRFASPSL